MAGAYVAKPAVSTSPTVPPGWNDDWPPPGATDQDYPGIDPDPFFPAPYPPGYVPEFSLVMTADTPLGYNGTASVTGSMRDYDTYVTNEPSAITWTAAIGGSAVNLRLDGEDDYALSLSSAVSYGTYWGATPSIEFELTGDNSGDTVVLTGISTISGETIVQTTNVEIYELSLVMSAAATLQYDATLTVTTSLRNDETLGTDEPTSSTLVWTATINSVAVDLRFSGDPSYSSSINSAYSDLGSFWGAIKNIEFELTTGNEDDILVLQATSTAFGSTLVITSNITITIPPDSFTCEYELSDVSGDFFAPSTIDIRPSPHPAGFDIYIYFNTDTGYSITNNEPSEWVTDAPEGIAASIAGSFASLRHFYFQVGLSATITFRTYNNEVLLNTLTRVESVGSLTRWLTWNPSTGVVTIINP